MRSKAMNCRRLNERLILYISLYRRCSFMALNTLLACTAVDDGSQILLQQHSEHCWACNWKHLSFGYCSDEELYIIWMQRCILKQSKPERSVWKAASICCSTWKLTCMSAICIALNGGLKKLISFSIMLVLVGIRISTVRSSCHRRLVWEDYYFVSPKIFIIASKKQIYYFYQSWIFFCAFSLICTEKNRTEETEKLTG